MSSENIKQDALFTLRTAQYVVEAPVLNLLCLKDMSLLD